MSQRSPRTIASRRTAAFSAIERAVCQCREAPSPLEKWRTAQIDEAIAFYMSGLYDRAIRQATRARLPVGAIPPAELRSPLVPTLDEMRERILMLRARYAR